MNFYPISILCNKHAVNTYYVLAIGNLKVKKTVSHSHDLGVQITNTWHVSRKGVTWS